MKNRENYRWFKPLLALVVGIAIYVVLEMILAFPMMFGNVRSFGEGAVEGAYGGMDYSNPITLALSLLSVAAFIPSIALAMRITRLGPMGTLSSVDGRLRKRVIRKAIPIMLIGGFVSNMIFILIDLALYGPEAFGEPRFLPLSILVVLLITPLQAAAEEYLYRGFLTQTIRSWIPVTVISLILQSVVFMVTHGYSALGLISVGITGLMLGYLTIKSGGLEIAICIHAVNNICAFLPAVIFPNLATKADITALSMIGTLVGDIVFFVLAVFIMRKNDLVVIDKVPEEEEKETE